MIRPGSDLTYMQVATKLIELGVDVNEQQPGRIKTRFSQLSQVERNQVKVQPSQVKSSRSQVKSRQVKILLSSVATCNLTCRWFSLAAHSRGCHSFAA